MDVKVRGVEPKDVERFAEWAMNNPQISKREIESALNNPTTQVLVVEIDGEPILYVPFYCLMSLAYLGFNPDATGKHRLRAMGEMLKALSAFARQYHIAEIQTLSKEEYPVAQWALKHDFKLDNRNPLRFEVPNV